MTLRRICTIDGDAYSLTGDCPACGNSMWTSIDPPIRHAGCTPTHCIQGIKTPDPAPNPVPVTPAITDDPIITSDDDDDDDDETWTPSQ